MLENGERRYVRRESANALAMYNLVRAENPGLTGSALYEKVIIRLTGADAEASRALVRAAEQSFAEWPKTRELTFRDVAHYLCFQRISETHGNRNWTRTLLSEVVDSVIPEDL
jgi:hypothetical protein